MNRSKMLTLSSDINTFLFSVVTFEGISRISKQHFVIAENIEKAKLMIKSSCLRKNVVKVCSTDEIINPEDILKKCSCGRKLLPSFYCNVCDNDE